MTPQWVIAGQQQALIPAYQDLMPTDILLADLETQACRFLPEKRCAPKRLQRVILWLCNDLLGQPLQRLLELVSQGESQAALGCCPVQVSHASAIEVQLAHLGTRMDHRPIAEDEVRSIVDRWSKCQDRILAQSIDPEPRIPGAFVPIPHTLTQPCREGCLPAIWAIAR